MRLKAVYDAERAGIAEHRAAEQLHLARLEAWLRGMFAALVGADPALSSASIGAGPGRGNPTAMPSLRAATGVAPAAPRMWLVVEVDARHMREVAASAAAPIHPSGTRDAEGAFPQNLPMVDGGDDAPASAAAAQARGGPLTPQTAARLGLASKATIYRLLKTLPAEIMLGTTRKTARWPNRVAFERWLADAALGRRVVARGSPESGRTRRQTRRSLEAAHGEESLLERARRTLPPKRR